MGQQSSSLPTEEEVNATFLHRLMSRGYADMEGWSYAIQLGNYVHSMSLTPGVAERSRFQSLCRSGLVPVIFDVLLDQNVPLSTIDSNVCDVVLHVHICDLRLVVGGSLVHSSVSVPHSGTPSDDPARTHEDPLLSTS